MIERARIAMVELEVGYRLKHEQACAPDRDPRTTVTRFSVSANYLRDALALLHLAQDNVKEKP